jgi:hypothetical protein
MTKESTMKTYHGYGYRLRRAPLTKEGSIKHLGWWATEEEATRGKVAWEAVNGMEGLSGWLVVPAIDDEPDDWGGIVRP